MANISSLTAPIGQAPYSPLMGLAVPASDVRLSDEVIDQLVVEIGADRVLCALDRLTSPKLPLRAAE
jgi:hypothetical protein